MQHLRKAVYLSVIFILPRIISSSSVDRLNYDPTNKKQSYHVRREEKHCGISKAKMMGRYSSVHETNRSWLYGHVNDKINDWQELHIKWQYLHHLHNPQRLGGVRGNVIHTIEPSLLSVNITGGESLHELTSYLRGISLMTDYKLYTNFPSELRSWLGEIY